MSRAIASARQRRAGITPEVSSVPQSSPQNPPQHGLTLPQVISVVDARLSKLEKFMNGLFNNHFPEQDLRHLDEIAHMNNELSLRTLSCYIR